MMLYKLLAAIDQDAFRSIVISLQDKGTIGARIEALGIPVYTLDARPGWSTPFFLLRLRALLVRNEISLVQAWMSHANIAATLACALGRYRRPVIWNIRQSLDNSLRAKRSTALIIRMGSALSRFPARIVYNSRVSAEQHGSRGYARDKTIIIANGFDCNVFKADADARNRLREQLALSADSVLIGMVARYAPMKDHANFLRAADILSATYPQARFVLVGNGITKENAELTQLIRAAGVCDKVHLLGERGDIPDITAGLDIASLSSAGWEGFPNVVGEAMACGIPCVVTDVGDTAWVAGATATIVPPKDPLGLAAGWARLIEAGPGNRRRIGAVARKRILDYFSLPRIAADYENLYREVAKDCEGTRIQGL